ncbi:MAG: beta-N-acetylglucosaminidase domain-containing protein [Kiritimatiellae bacterium]|nr:beta-N-acetylglucosaminidase domain-containing protein [Kiritimatiellia bacterium]
MKHHAMIVGLATLAGVCMLTTGGQAQAIKPGINVDGRPAADTSAAGYQIPAERQGPEFMVPFFTGKIYPTPHDAKYLDEWIPLGKTGIVPGAGVKKDDARLAVLLERIVRYGGSVKILDAAKDSRDVDSYICVGAGAEADKLCVDKPPARPEGFLLDAGQLEGKPAAVVKGHDSLGLLWGITALNQMITRQDGKTVLKKTAARDYPDAPGRRCYPAMGEPNAEAAWFSIQCMRPNWVQYRGRSGLGLGVGQQREFVDDPKTYPIWQENVRKAAALLAPLGITWSDMTGRMGDPTKHPGVGRPVIRSKSDDGFQALLSRAKFCEEHGGHLFLNDDDFRFPIHPDDARDFGTAREADVYFLNKFMAALKKDCPSAKLFWCPPCYVGPVSELSEHIGESHEGYLKAMGERLPPDVLIAWAGPRVKSAKEKPEYLQWITGLIKRPPVFWQNAVGPRETFYPYDTDPVTQWPDWYYPGFLDGLAFLFINHNAMLVNMTLFDFMWNPGKYDAQRSIVEAGKKVVGPEAYPKFAAFYKLLEKMDEYGLYKPTALAARNLEDVKAKTARLRTAYDELLKLSPDAVQWTQAPSFMRVRESYLKRLIATPDFMELTKADEEVRAMAARETGADPKADIILAPGDFQSKRPSMHYKWKDMDRRYVTWINGRESGLSSLTASFRLKDIPLGEWELVICGLDHNAKPPCRIRITVNGNEVFDGENKLQFTAWSRQTIPMPAKFLRGNDNQLTIENLEDSDAIGGPPWFMVNYVVLRPAADAAQVQKEAKECAPN